ncbi:MAG TPA: hypothetical protein VE223_07310 [Nitrososphaeraceae archaeon]|nr:hypothetical protein [Nitrososphaeraceae archaeon]
MKLNNRYSATLSKKLIVRRLNTIALVASITAAFVIGFSIITSLVVTVTAQPVPVIGMTTGTTSNIKAVNITSPTKGQQVPLGKDLTILGTSVGNASTSNCQVIVGLNGIKPYTSATGTGPGGPKDYSKWSFTLTPKYAMLKPGPDNKITARYKCSGTSSNNNSNLVLVSSVNVTGVATATNIPANQLQRQSPSIIENNATISASRKDTGIPWLP